MGSDVNPGGKESPQSKPRAKDTLRLLANPNSDGARAMSYLNLHGPNVIAGLSALVVLEEVGAVQLELWAHGVENQGFRWNVGREPDRVSGLLRSLASIVED